MPSSHSASTRHGRVAREIDLQRRHRDEALRHGVEIGAGPGILLRPGRSRPSTPAGRADRCACMTAAERCRKPRRLARKPRCSSYGRSGTFTLRMKPRSSGFLSSCATSSRATSAAAAKCRPPARGAQRHGDRRQAQEAPLDRGSDGAGIQHVVAQVRAVVHSRDDHVVLEVEQAGDRKVHAVRRCAGHEVHPGLGLEHAQRDIQGEGVAGAALVAVRGNDSHRASVESASRRRRMPSER